MHTPFFLLVICLALVLPASICDWRTGRIPNSLTLPALGLGGLVQVAAHALLATNSADWSRVVFAGVSNAAIGAIGCGLVPYLLFRVEAMGGGDVKLLAATGSLVGPVLGLELELVAFLSMVIYAAARLAYEGRLLPVVGNSAVLLLNPLVTKSRRREVPRELLTSLKFGPAVLVGNVLVLLHHGEMLP